MPRRIAGTDEKQKTLIEDFGFDQVIIINNHTFII
jgi:hypothetical protein